MDTNKEAKKYLNKYFKAQYLKETDDEYKALVKLLNKALRIHDVVGRSEQLVCDCGKPYHERDLEHAMCHKCWEPIKEAN